MSDDAPVEEEEDDQAWLATFADLMSLLMCFFVLLLSFSEMDLEKYRQIAGSLRTAFGVQRQVEAHEPPKGTSFIAQEFTPGKPVQIPVDITKQEGDKAKGEKEDSFEAKLAQTREEIEETLEKLAELLAPEIESGTIEMVTIDGEIVVRILEGDSFPSGSARLQKSFLPILDRLVQGLDENSGRLIVAGHTDNVPISTRAYPSNWVLSSARAANVVHHITSIANFNPEQIEMRAYADTRPLADNELPENRARNRRVEVIVSYADPTAAPDETAEPTVGDETAQLDSTAPVVGDVADEPASAAALQDTDAPSPAPAPAPQAPAPIAPVTTPPPAAPLTLPATVQPPPPLELEAETDEPDIRIDSE